MADRFESVFDMMDQEKGVVTAPTSSVEGNVVAASPDRFESVFDQMDKVKQEQDGMSWTAGKTIPEAEAVDVIGLSDHFKVAPDFAARNAKQLRAQKRVEDSDFALVKNSAPVVSKWATENPYNSSVAMDDIKNLAKIEEMVKDHVEDNSMAGFMQKAFLDAVPVLGEYRKFKRDVEKSPLAQYGLAQAGLTAARIPGGVASTGALGVNVGIRDKGKAPFVQSAVDAALPGAGAALGAIGKIDEAVNPEGGIVEPPRVLLDNPLTRYLEDKMKSIDIPEMNASVTKEIASGNYRKAGKALAYQFAANAPTQALIIASTLINPAAGIGAIVGVGAGTAGTATKEAQDAGLSPLAAQTRGAFHGAAEAGLEYVGTFGILKHWSGALAKSFGKDTARKVMSDMLKTMTYAFAGEANEEASTEAVQYATDVLTGYEKEPFSLRTMGIRMADAAIQGGVMGLGMTGPSAIGGGIARSEGIKNATRVKNFYNALGDSIESTKLRQSLPEKTYEIVSRLTKDGPVENIFIPTEAIETYAQSAKVDALEFTHSIGALESYKAAKEGSGVMKIPMAEWVKNVVGSEAYKGLANDIKFSPNEFTVNESIRFREQMQKVADERAPEMESIGSVYDDFRSKVMAVGATPEEADAHAMLVAERERIRGQILGEDPLALYKKDNFEINRFQTPDQIAQVEDVQFNQSLPDDWQTGPARAVFRGWQDQGSFGDPFPLYNIIGEHPKARSTVAETTLKSMGIDVPATPAFDEWAKSAPVQALHQSAVSPQTETPQFKEWFGDSVVTDNGKPMSEGGKPLVVYHGTAKMFDQFKKTAVGEFGSGMYFTTDPEEAGGYAKNLSGVGDIEMGSNIKPVYLAIKNPFIVKKNPSEFHDTFGSPTTTDEQSVQNAIDAGYDGIAFRRPVQKWIHGKGSVITGTMQTHYVVFDPTQIKSATGNAGTFDPKNPSILRQSAVNAPIFYSQLQSVIEQKMPNAAPASMVKNLLDPSKGNVKAEEVEWSGLNEWLQGKDKVTKAELLDFLKSNEVQIKEVVKGDRTMQEMNTFYASDRSATKFAKYQLPGGENYREVLLTLPPTINQVPSWKVIRPDGHVDMTFTTEISARSQARISGPGYTVKQGETIAARGGFKSSHFDETNILAHVRMNDRTTADGKKVLFVEEVQSDWHQQGRDKGYAGDLSKKELVAIDRDGYFEVQTKDGQFVTNTANNPEIKTADQAIAEAHKRLSESPQRTGASNSVPNAPFKKSWHEMALKRVLRYAVDNGYDGIAWTTGEQQAERYDLSKDVQSVEYLDGFLRVKTHAERGGTRDFIHKEMPPEKIQDYIGKEPAKKLLESPKTQIGQQSGIPIYRQMIEGEDLKVGGEGMKGFYDQIIPSFLRKYIKKWGGRVSTINVGKNDAGRISFPDSGSIDKYSGLSLNPVDEIVGASTDNRQVLNSIVGSLPVDVVNILSANGISPEDFVRDPKMLTDRLPIQARLTVTDGIRNALTKTGALLRTGLNSAYKARLDGEIIPALRASDIDTDVATGILFPKHFVDLQRGASGDIGVVSGGTDSGTVSRIPPMALNGGKDFSAKLAGFRKWHESIIPQRRSDINNFKSWGLEITPSMRESVAQGQPLFQSQKGKDPRAQIRFGKDSINIDLFKNADLSSLVHELWHVFAKQIGQDLETVKAKPEGDLSFVQRQFVQDGDAILKWVGADSFATLTTEQHEQIARAGELFLREGKAPSSTLRGAFARFREWLLMVYRTVAQLDVQLTPEVREVFSRLLASQDEIKIAQEELNIAPLFADAKSVGMTNAQAEKYAEALAEAKAAGEEELATKIMAEMKRREMKPYLDRKAEIEAEATRYVDTHIDYIALSVLQRGKFPDGNPLPDGEIPAKLSRKAIVDQYGEERLSRLPKPYVYSRQGGITPDEAAIKFGYPSGDALLTTLENIRPKDQVVAEIVDSKLKAEFGDMKTDGTIAKEAMDAVHNEKRAQLLKKEMDHLVSEEFSTFKNIVRRVSRPVPSVEAVREQAQYSIRGMSVRDIYPSMYQRAESKASREAVEAMLKGDMETAFTAKLKERLNHELYRAAVDAKDSVDGMVKYFKRFDDNDVRARIGKAGGTYLDQIEGLLERFQFKKSVTLKELDRRKSLVQWVMEQKEAGVQVDIPQELLNEANRLHYKDTPYGTLVDLEETIKMIEHTAVFKNKLLANERARTVEEAVSDISASIAAHHTVDNKPVSIEPTLKERFLEKPSEFLASHAKMEFIAQILDGDKKLGPMYRHVIEPLLKAGDNEANKIHDASARLEDIFSVYTKTERATWYYKKIHIPALGQYLYKPTILAMAMNQGNPYNQEALLEGLRGLGYVGWTQDHVDAALDTLDERDIKVVNDVHALLESYWPEASALEKRVNGVAPEKVQGVPMQLKNGRINGGYYPIKFDHNRSWISMKRLEEELAKGQMGQHWAKAMTKQGHLKERTNTGGNPLRLDLGIINEHIQNVVHDVTHREAVIDVHRIINENQFRDMIVKTIGMNFYKEFQPWLNSIAGQVNTESISWLESLASHAKKGVTVVALGLKVSSGLMQTAGYGNTFKELGEKYALVGLKKMGKDGANLKALWDEISEKSVEMKYRLSTYDRDVRETMNKLNVTGTKRGIMSVPEIYTSDAYKAYFGFIGMMDLAVSIPSWLGAYEKAMDGKVKGIDKANEKDAILYADQVVRMTQSANRVMDLARIQRGNQVQKLFTMFYSQMSIQYNQFLKTGMMVGQPGGKADVIRAFIYMMFVQSVITDFIRGNGSGEDDDKWWKRIAKDMAFIPLETMIVLRDIASGLDRFGYSGSPAFDVGKTLTGTAKSLGQRVFGDKEELTEADMKKIVKSAGYVFALPTGQAWKTAEYLHAWMLGNEEPDNVMQGVWKALVTGKKR